jgi:D-alanyl-D-alanine carboxypeptidase (penicillin-binding protein 5/6)
VLVIGAAIAFVAVELVRAEPKLSVSPTALAHVTLGGRAARLPWPSRGAAAVELRGGGAFGAVHGTLVTPLASVTKLMTALVVLKRHPLASGASGPTLTVTAADAALYRADRASGQSVLKVRPGEQLSELQALEGLLVPSANNIAVLLARWDAGSVARFVEEMNAMAATLALKHTHFVEPSGLAPGNAGTAIDMMHLGLDALANPTIATIVGFGEVSLPVAGIVLNYDYDVGHHGIIGIKTGSSSAAGGTFVFAARRSIDGRPVTVVGAVLKQEGPSVLAAALAAGERLANAALNAVGSFSVVRAGQTVLRVSAPWGSRPVLGTAARAVSYFGVPGTTAVIRTVLSPVLTGGRVRSLTAGERLATLEVTVGGHTTSVPVVASRGLGAPTLRYRLTRL